MANQFKERGFDPKHAPMYAQMLVGMVALTGQWWLDARKPEKADVAAHLVNLAWNGLSGLEAKPGSRPATALTTTSGPPLGPGRRRRVWATAKMRRNGSTVPKDCRGYAGRSRSAYSATNSVPQRLRPAPRAPAAARCPSSTRAPRPRPGGPADTSSPTRRTGSRARSAVRGRSSGSSTAAAPGRPRGRRANAGTAARSPPARVARLAEVARHLEREPAARRDEPTSRASRSRWPGTHCSVALDVSTSTGRGGAQARRSPTSRSRHPDWRALLPRPGDHLGGAVHALDLGGRPAVGQLAVRLPGPQPRSTTYAGSDVPARAPAGRWNGRPR